MKGGTSDVMSNQHTDYTLNWQNNNMRSSLHKSQEGEMLYKNVKASLNVTKSDGRLPLKKISNNENAFFLINREYKGIAAQTDKAK